MNDEQKTKQQLIEELRELRLRLADLHRSGEIRLSESEQRYESVVNNIGVGVALISPNMEILSLNRQMRQWFPDVDPSRKPICYMVFNNPPQEEVCSYCPTHKTLNDGLVHESVTDTPAGGKVINFRVVSSPIRDEHGKVIAAIEMVEDVTEQMKVRKLLAESEARYRALVEQVPMITYTSVIDETSTTLYISPQVEKILGYTQKEYLADPDIWYKLLHPLDRERVLLEVMKSHRSGKPFASEYRMRSRTGHDVWILDEAALVRDDAGAPLCLQGIMFDITERKHMEQRIIDALEFNQRIFETSPVGIAVYEVSGKCVSANKTAARIIGISPDQLRKQNFYQVESWKRSGLLETAMAALREGIEKDRRVNFVTASGKEIRLDCRFVPFTSLSVQHLLLMFIDTPLP